MSKQGGGQKRDVGDGAINTPGARMLNVIGGIITGRRGGWMGKLRVNGGAEERRRREAVGVRGFTGSGEML